MATDMLQFSDEDWAQALVVTSYLTKLTTHQEHGIILMITTAYTVHVDPQRECMLAVPTIILRSPSPHTSRIVA
jgi:hypothetical protein